jgi:serine/threonine protein kinase
VARWALEQLCSFQLSAAAAAAQACATDLRPGNILLNSRGVPKIANFGLAREHASTTVYAADDARMLAVRYMAPELLQVWNTRGYAHAASMRKLP